jgi:hypothetical protein
MLWVWLMYWLAFVSGCGCHSWVGLCFLWGFWLAHKLPCVFVRLFDTLAGLCVHACVIWLTSWLVSVLICATWLITCLTFVWGCVLSHELTYMRNYKFDSWAGFCLCESVGLALKLTSFCLFNDWLTSWLLGYIWSSRFIQKHICVYVMPLVWCLSFCLCEAAGWLSTCIVFIWCSWLSHKLACYCVRLSVWLTSWIVSFYAVKLTLELAFLCLRLWFYFLGWFL